MDYLEEFNSMGCNADDNMDEITNGNKSLSKSQTVTLRSRALSTSPQITPTTTMVVKETESSTSVSTENAGQQTLDIADFECSLCFRLFCKPVSTSCGHTYCK